MDEYNKFQNNRIGRDGEDANNAMKADAFDGTPHGTEPQNQTAEHYNYHWHEDDFATAMSGKVSEKQALSLYKPREKKHMHKMSVFIAAVVSAVITSLLCCSIFAVSLGAFRKETLQKKPQSNTLSLGGAQGTEATAPATTTAPGGQLSVPDIYDKVSPTVVSIVSTISSGGSYLLGTEAKSGGSGVILTADGYIITNYHVIEGASAILVKTTANQTLPAQVVGKDSRTDLAVLKVDCDEELPYAELGDSSLLRVGDMAVAIGNPLQDTLASTLTVGYISAIDRNMVIENRQMTLLQTDAAINPGNSGGALINVYGQVIGINTAKSTGYDIEGIGFAIPINEAIPVIESIVENGYVKGRPLVGMTGVDVTERIAKANDLPMGVYVESVLPGGAAEQGGIKAGDVILKFDGKDITSIEEINEIRDDHKVGDEIIVVLSRKGEEKTVTIILQEESPVDETKSAQQDTSKPNNRQNGQTIPFPSDFFSWFGW